MATMAQIRITSVKAGMAAEGAGMPFDVVYYMQFKDDTGAVGEAWVTRNTDGAILTDAAFGAWWDANVMPVQELFADGPKTWALTKAMLPSEW